jgi:hypothetical protein
MQSSVRFFALMPEHSAILAQHRMAIEDLRAQIFAEGQLPSLIEATQVLLNENLIPSDLIAYQEAVGVVIGDDIVSRAGFRWLSVEFDGVLEPSVCHPEKSLFVSPLSAVVKRFRRGETKFDAGHFITEAIRACQAQAPEASELTLS